MKTLNTVLAGLMTVGMAHIALAGDNKGPVTRPQPTGPVTVNKGALQVMKPDLVIADWKHGSKTNEIWVLVKNIGGNNPFKQETLLQVHITEPKVGNYKDYGHSLTPSLKHNESKWILVTMFRDAYSDVKLDLIADCKDQLPEGNENNNVKSLNLYVK